MNRIETPRSSNRRVAAVLALGLITLTTTASGQDQAEPPPIRPTTIDFQPVKVNAPTLIREGAFLSAMHGELRSTELGLVMDFAPDSKTGERLGSMILQRGMTLTAMEQIIEAHEEPIGFIVSGQVFVFHGRNYLLPTKFAITTEIDRSDRSADAEADPFDQVRPPSFPAFEDASREPTIEGLIEGVERNTNDAGDLPVPPTGAAAARLREGKMIAQVRGRVLPGAGGDLIFTQDADADLGASDSDDLVELPPMRLMPCLNVERLEELRKEWGDQLVVNMSGRIFVDAGRPTLLPTMYIIELERAGNLTLGQ